MTEPARVSDLAALRPDVRGLAYQWLDTLRAARGVAASVVIGETARSPERQDWLYASGRTRPGPIVTALRGDSPKARHVAPFGQATAFDFWFVVPGLSPWAQEHPWALAGVVGEYLGFTWGGRWKAADLGHLEFNGAAPGPRVLARGSRGDTVRVLQQSLAARGFDPGPADGMFGARTEAAVRELQKLSGIDTTGVVDAATALRAGIVLA